MSELILAVGDDNVKFQVLLNDAQSIEKTKRGTRIVFYTDAVQAEEMLGVDQSKNIGLVLWMPRDKFDVAIRCPEEPAARSDACKSQFSVKRRVRRSFAGGPYWQVLAPNGDEIAICFTEDQASVVANALKESGNG